MMTLASIAWPLMALASIVWPLLIYWLVLFVVCFVLVEIGHDQLYDEAPKYAGWRVFGGSLILASLLTALRYKGFAASFDSMFTTNIGWTLLQGVVWFLVFMFVFQFHPWHALGTRRRDDAAGIRVGDDGRRQSARQAAGRHGCDPAGHGE